MNHQSPECDSQNLSNRERAALRQLRNRRWQALCGGAGALALTLCAAACSQAADPQTPPAGGSPGVAGNGTTGGSATGGSGTGGSGGGGAVCESPCIDKLFTADLTACKLCHSNDVALGGLNLAAGYTARLKDIPAKHLDGMDPEMPLPASAGCMPASLINTANPAESWLWKKVSMGQGMCGDPMPQTTAIKPADQACIKTYIECVAGKPIVASGGAPAATGGTGGVATGSGGTGGT